MRHGTRWGYNCGCRCVDCCAANTEAQRRRRRRRRLVDPTYTDRRRPRHVSLDALLGDDSFALFASIGVQRHMVEWWDPTADAALAS